MAEQKHLAIDLGASSGRCILGSYDAGKLKLEIVHQFPNGGHKKDGRLYWNEQAIWNEILNGLAKVAELGHKIETIGVDTWGVDFGLLDENNCLLANPFHYRDSHTAGALEQAFEVLPRDAIFAETGIQFMELNSLYQLFAMQRDGDSALANAKRFLMIPDLLHWMLSGEITNELTNASTTQIYNPVTRNWSSKIISTFGFPDIFEQVTPPSTVIGQLKDSLATQIGLGSPKIVLPCTHDTGSAVFAVPADGFAEPQPNWCYISSGTWSCMGLELAEPRTDQIMLEYNFTNEIGIGNTARLLKNIAGLWILQQCRANWQAEGSEYAWDDLVAQAKRATPFKSIVDADDREFVAPENMLSAVTNFCKRSDQAAPESVGEFVRCALESLALKYRIVFDTLGEINGKPLELVHIVGGGSQNQLLCQMTADVCQVPVIAGPVEATATGNLLAQMLGLGTLGSCEEARNLVRSSFQLITYEPQSGSGWDEALAKLKSMMGN